MQETARTSRRSAVRSEPRRAEWGIVDAILALVMLPFAVWVFLIDRMVAGIAALQRP